MQALRAKSKVYHVDGNGFLFDPMKWDEGFAEGMARELGIAELTPEHWDILNFIRNTYLSTGSCPTVHKTCQVRDLSIRQLERLFPTGYQRGACRLAGVSSLVDRGKIAFPWVSYPSSVNSPASSVCVPICKRVYKVNIQGFLMDHGEWDEDYAIYKARELQITGTLSEKHWQVIRFLRAEYKRSGEVPTIYATCAETGIEIEEMAELFPSGYHRGAVRIAGLNPVAAGNAEAPAATAFGRG